MFAICLAWINYSWLASAYDTDDVFFRVATMMQMLGVLVLALGLPDAFESIDEGEHLDNGVMVAGYVIMRVATIALWLRIARHDPAHRRSALTYAVVVGAIQVGWVVTIFINPPLNVMFGIIVVLGTLELVCPYLIERRVGGTPWHAHHIAERYGLLVIITLGEVVLGTILAISAVVEEQGWTVEAALVAFGGTLLAFAMWWVYFTMPSAKVLTRFRERGFTWGYGHFFIFGSLAATGAGLHVAAYEIEGVAHIGTVEALLTVVVPVAGLLGRAVHPVLAAAAAVRPVPHLALHRQHGHARDRRVGGCRRREHGNRHRAHRALARRRHRRLRDRRPPAPGGGARTGARRLTERRRGADVATSAPRDLERYAFGRFARSTSRRARYSVSSMSPFANRSASVDSALAAPPRIHGGPYDPSGPPFAQ